MPAFKKNNISVTNCITGGGCLHVCRKSSMSRNSNSSMHEVEKLLSIQNCELGCKKVEILPHDVRSDESYGCTEFCSPESIEFKRWNLPAEDPGFVETMDYLQSTCSSTLDAIFSPINESNGNHCNLNAQDDEGSYDDPISRLSTSYYYDITSCNSTAYQSAHVSDFSMLNSNVGGFSEDEIHIMKNNLYPEFGYPESNILMDWSNNCIMLSCLEETINTHYQRSCEAIQENTSNSWFNMVSQQIKPCNQDVNPNYDDTDEADCFDPQLFLKNCPDLSDMEHDLLPALLPIETCKQKCVTLVLDLDETLVHSTLQPSDNADFTIQVNFNSKEHTVYVRERPFLRSFLETVADMFEIIVFTASQSIYAEQLLDVLDPDGKIFSRRVYRESCIILDGSYTKDLTVLGIDLSKVAIIDNSPQVFRLQVSNGIPIQSWFDDPSDRALISLIPFLKTLVNVEDVRPIIASHFSI